MKCMCGSFVPVFERACGIRAKAVNLRSMKPMCLEAIIAEAEKADPMLCVESSLFLGEAMKDSCLFLHFLSPLPFYLGALQSSLK